MTNEQRERLARYRSGEAADYKTWQLVLDLEAEREAVLQILEPACHSGTNAKTHDAIYRALVAMGARPEVKEQTK